MKINIKNNCNLSSEKYSAISDFLKFSQSRSRLKKPIDIVLVDTSKVLNLENRYFIMTKDIPFGDVIKILSEVWITEFAKQNKIDVSNIDEFKKGNKFVIPKDKIKIPDEFSMTGFKAFEKTTLQSIFDTQKPFMEIVGVAIGSVAKAEDVIARVMPFFGNPLTLYE